MGSDPLHYKGSSQASDCHYTFLLHVEDGWGTGVCGAVCMHRILNLQSVTEGVSMVTALRCRHGIQLEWFLSKQMIPA